MKIPSSAIQGNTRENHPLGDFSATVVACSGELTPTGSYELKVTFKTDVGTVTQKWDTEKVEWKVRIFRDSLGIQGDFDTDSAIGEKIDLKVFKSAANAEGKSYTNFETHPAGSLVTESETVPPTIANAANDVPF